MESVKYFLGTNFAHAIDSFYLGFMDTNQLTELMRDYFVTSSTIGQLQLVC